MADLEEAGLSLVVEGGNAFESEINSANNAAESFGSGMESVGSGIDAVGEVITGALRAVGEIAVTSLLAAGGAVMDFLGDSFAGALEAEETMARLGQVIESTGGIAGVTVADAEALADEFKNLAGGSDDAVISIIDMGLRMGTISEEMMPGFIQSTLDLGAVMGDAGKASQLMARAVEDPVGVLGALRKAGILVNETTEAQIKAMVAAGDTAGAYSLLMDRVGEATSGAAETMSETNAGRWAIFQETLADAGETIVGAFLPALNGILTAFTPIIPIIEQVAGGLGSFIETIVGGGDVGTAFDNLAAAMSRAFGPETGLFVMQLGDTLTGIYDWVVANLPAMQATFTTVFTAVQTSIQTAVDWVVANWPQIQTNIETSWTVIQPVLQALGDFITTTLIPAFQTAVDWVVTNWPTIQANIETVMTAIQTVINAVMSVVAPFILEKFGEIKAWVDDNWPLIQATVETVINAINTVITTVVTAVSAFWKENHDAILSVATAIWDTIKLNIETAITLIEGIIKTTMQLITGDWDGAWATIKETAATIWENIKTQIDTSINAVKTVIETVVGALQTWWDTTWAAIQTKVGTIIGEILTTITTKIDEIKAAFTAIDWIKVGSDIVANVATGISNVASSLATNAANAANDAYHAMLRALGIESPSPMLIAIGAHFGEDVGTGISDSALLAVKEAERAARNIVSGIVKTLAGATGIDKMANIPAIASAKSAMGIVPPADSFGYSGSRVPAPPGPAYSPPAFSGGPATGSPVTISIDARGASPTETQRAVTHALQEAGQYSDTRLRLRGAM